MRKRSRPYEIPETSEESIHDSIAGCIKDIFDQERKQYLQKNKMLDI
jgi:hypothetical protein